jgi:hypothetical protein
LHGAHARGPAARNKHLGVPVTAKKLQRQRKSKGHGLMLNCSLRSNPELVRIVPSAHGHGPFSMSPFRFISIINRANWLIEPSESKPSTIANQLDSMQVGFKLYSADHF